MTNEEIQCLILKLANNDAKGAVHLSDIVLDYGIDAKIVLFNARILRDEGLMKTQTMGGSTPMALSGDVEITKAGRREYKSRCKQ